MLILKNVTAVQLHPAKVQEGVDIAIENEVIVAIGDALTQRYPDASYKEMHGRIVMPGIVCCSLPELMLNIARFPSRLDIEYCPALPSRSASCCRPMRTAGEKNHQSLIFC